MELYEWQEKVVDLWRKNGEKGVLKAVPGSGKTKAGTHLIRTLLAQESDARVLIVAPTRTILNQWKEEIPDYPDNVEFVTYFGANKIRDNLDGTGDLFSYRLVVFDECHSLLSPVRGKAIGIPKKGVLGLSATPGESTRLLGGIITQVGWDEANIAPFKIRYLCFDMTPGERFRYEALSRDVRRVMQRADERAGRPVPHDVRMAVIMKRRSFVYTLRKRIDIAIQMVKTHPEDRIIIFSERLEQVDEIVALLWAEGIPCAMLTSRADSISEYMDGTVRVLVTSKMVKEGFNDPSTTMGIMVSTPLTERNQVQTLGRVIRSFPDKLAVMYILLAKGTTDLKLLRNGIPGEAVDLNGGEYVPPERSPETNLYYQGRKMSLDSRGRLFANGSKGRTYYKDIPELITLVRHFKRSGTFVLHDTGVFVTQDGVVRRISDRNFIPDLVVEREPGFTWTEEDEQDLCKRLGF